MSVRSFGDTTINVVYKHLIAAGAGDDTIIADSTDAIFIVEAGTGNDFMDIKSSGGTFDAGEGNDDIYTLQFSRQTIFNWARSNWQLRSDTQDK